MAVDMTSSPFHETSAFEDDWRKAVSNNDPNLGGLDLIASFNASYEGNAGAFDEKTTEGSVDPQLLNSTPAASPDQSTEIFDGPFGGNQDEFAHLDFTQPTPMNTPYFHAATEASVMQMTPTFASPLRNQLHRRSVSEPPEGALHHHQPPASSYFIPSGPPMTLTRSGHYLGQPKLQRSSPRGMKDADKNKPTRGQPYAVKNSLYRKPAPQPQHRFDFRRSNTQPVQTGNAPPPTSLPQGMSAAIPHPPPPQPPVQTHPHTRVYTPAPAPSPYHHNAAAGSPPIDPMLQHSVPPNKVVSIPVDELRKMITEAVRRAVEGTGAVKKRDGSKMVGRSEGGVVDEENGTVVASVEDREVGS